MKRTWKDYFIFSRKERLAIGFLLVTMACFLLLPYFYAVNQQRPEIDPALKSFFDNRQNDSLNAGNQREEITMGKADVYKAASHKLFFFDPNTISMEGWIQLGLRPATAKTIQHYLAKGGRFRKPEDIRKIWGIRQEQADRLMPYVQLNALRSSSAEKMKLTTQNKRQFSAKSQPLDINQAAVEDWQALPGIGSVLANRIMQYRDRVGGFYTVLQLEKVFGMNDTLLQQLAPFLQVNVNTLPKLDLNNVSISVLSERTGISPAVARGILIYRQQNGPFQSVSDLKKIVFITDSVFAILNNHVAVIK
jgi:competence ComEA-like helix-hairpin-helix protein